MRITVTLDSDVEALLRAAMRQRGVSFKEALSSAVRAGLTQSRPGRRRFIQRSFRLGGEQNFRWDKAVETAAAMEDEEITRKLPSRK